MEQAVTPYRFPRTFVHVSGETMEPTITHLGDGLWELRIPHGTSPQVVAAAIHNTVFANTTLADDNVFHEDVDDTTIVYAGEPIE
jgi:hypothetical protein